MWSCKVRNCYIICWLSTNGTSFLSVTRPLSWFFMWGLGMRLGNGWTVALAGNSCVYIHVLVLQLPCYYSLTKCRLSCQSLQWQEVSTPLWGHLVWRTQPLPGLCLPGHWSNCCNYWNHPAPYTSPLFTVVRKQCALNSACVIQVLWHSPYVCTLISGTVEPLYNGQHWEPTL